MGDGRQELIGTGWRGRCGEEGGGKRHRIIFVEPSSKVWHVTQYARKAS